MSHVCGAIAVDTIGWPDDALQAHVTELKSLCTSCKEAREAVDEWLEQRSIMWTDVGANIKEHYKFFTGELSPEDISLAYGDASASERARWTDRVLWLSMRARVHPEKVVDALRRKICVRCGCSPASTCVAYMCGACCHGKDCRRHSKDRRSS